MKNALLLLGKEAGNKDFSKRLDYVKKQLSMAFDRLDIAIPTSAYDAFETERKAIGKYHSLIVIGGDGSFNTAVNALACKKDAPVLGYINEGTLGDVGRAYGISSSLRQALKIISEGNVKEVDVGECGGRYFAYMCAVGRYSDISYAVNKKEKKALGKLSYYKMAVSEALGDVSLDITVTDDKGKREYHGPFTMVLNGRNVGGFPINSKGDIADGYMECYVAGNGPLGGLLSFFTPNKKGVESFLVRKVEINPVGGDWPWCLDGELGPFGKVEIICHHKAMKVYAKAKRKQI